MLKGIFGQPTSQKNSLIKKYFNKKSGQELNDLDFKKLVLNFSILNLKEDKLLNSDISSNIIIAKLLDIKNEDGVESLIKNIKKDLEEEEGEDKAPAIKAQEEAEDNLAAAPAADYPLSPIDKILHNSDNSDNALTKILNTYTERFNNGPYDKNQVEKLVGLIDSFFKEIISKIKKQKDDYQSYFTLEKLAELKLFKNITLEQLKIYKEKLEKEKLHIKNLDKNDKITNLNQLNENVSNKLEEIKIAETILNSNKIIMNLNEIIMKCEYDEKIVDCINDFIDDANNELTLLEKNIKNLPLSNKLTLSDEYICKIINNCTDKLRKLSDDIMKKLSVNMNTAITVTLATVEEKKAKMEVAEGNLQEQEKTTQDAYSKAEKQKGASDYWNNRVNELDQAKQTAETKIQTLESKLKKLNEKGFTNQNTDAIPENRRLENVTQAELNKEKAAVDEAKEKHKEALENKNKVQTSLKILINQEEAEKEKLKRIKQDYDTAKKELDKTMANSIKVTSPEDIEVILKDLASRINTLIEILTDLCELNKPD